MEDLTFCFWVSGFFWAAGVGEGREESVERVREGEA